MATTTQILFNAPALHSLKRDQLVKLCKIHSIKASGKNVELIERLKSHAQTLTTDSSPNLSSGNEPTKDARGSEPNHFDENESMKSQAPRPSEQWEVVMESIEELEESSSQGTLSSLRTLNNAGSTGEFGIGGSKSTSVSSSIKALASSLGLKRSASSKSTLISTASSKSTLVEAYDELTKNSMPYSSVAPAEPPQTDHFTFTPRHTLRPGVPAPNTHKQQPTTTIRLISASNTNSGAPGTPQLKPFHTTFDLVLEAQTSSWPRHEDDQPKLYPPLPYDDATTTAPTVVQGSSQDVDMPGTLGPSNPSTPSRNLQLPTSSTAFVFGSPHPPATPQTEFKFRSAAASVLDEMNKRLQEEGVEEVQVGLLDQLGKRPRQDNREIKALPRKSVGGNIKAKFEKMHEQEFKKMEGIDVGVKRRQQASPVKLETSEVGSGLGKKRKSSVIEGERGARKVSGTRVINRGRRGIPGAFGDEEDEDELVENDIRGGKRARVDGAVVGREQEPEAVQESEADKEKEEERKAKEREAIRRKLDMNKARRRSSAAAGGRVSMGKGRVSIGRGAPVAKAKSRFGFLSSAKTMVQSVWNRGKATPNLLLQPMQLPLPPHPKAQTDHHRPTTQANRKISIAPVPAKPSTLTGAVTSITGRVPSIRLGKEKEPDKGTIASSSSRARSPIPSFNMAPCTSRNSTLAPGGVSSIGVRSSIAKAGEAKRASGSGFGSSGSRMSGLGSTSSRMSNLGSRLSVMGSASSRPSAMGSTGSRLLAPTATPIHTPTSAPFSPTPRPGGIFSKPLATPSGIPTPIKARPAVEQKSMAGRKPRISRSKVIARLASQRAASGSSSRPIGSGVTAVAGGKTRSSLGAKVQRKSFGGNGARGGRRSGPGDVLMSAKKRARQSEYARRRSRVGTAGANGMDVDP
ncbi:hypothetical protein BD779DRAFT_1508513 [Infundibulicybe gibba]|nr:hypothetical protein BD779DRAFT_1508513 [Infundibulicybe gibba]